MLNLSLEMKEYNVRTTAYCPGGVATNMKVHNSRYRPSRFGGPSEGTVHVPKAAFQGKPPAFYPPEAIAPIVLRAVENNRPFVFDHAEQRRFFRETYSGIVEACYDDIEAYEKEQGVPAGVPLAS
jgi:NAD(P)-dependent dehydrogenase (short-subunit alcohol dehydrogenase family)